VIQLSACVDDPDCIFVCFLQSVHDTFGTLTLMLRTRYIAQNLALRTHPCVTPVLLSLILSKHFIGIHKSTNVKNAVHTSYKNSALKELTWKDHTQPISFQLISAFIVTS